MVLFEKHTVLTNQEIRYNLRINKNPYAVLNTEIKRLCDKDLIRRVGRGVYTIVWNTRWGKVVPTEVEITNNFYMANGEGYMSGPAYYNAIGISTLIPNRKEITTNKYNYILDNLANTDIMKPRKTITNGNRLYLQLLDGIYYLSKNHCDAPKPLEMFAKQLKQLQLDEITLILNAKKLYPKFVLDMVLEMEEVYHNDEHLYKDDFALLIRRAAEHSDISADIIEKDYYVTLMLEELAGKQDTVKAYFKGGNSSFVSGCITGRYCGIC